MSQETLQQTGPVKASKHSPIWQHAAASVTLLLAAAIPLLFLQLGSGRGWFDVQRYHVPTIRNFAHQLPFPDLTNYLSATTPGYHLAIAAIVRTFGLSKPAILITSIFFSISLFALFAAALARAGASRSRSLLLTAPAVASVYLLSPAVTPIPDNAGWLAVAAALWFATSRNWSPARYFYIAITLAVVVFFRQSHIWVAAVIAAAAWIDAPTKPHAAIPSVDYPGLGIRRLFADTASRLKPTLLVAAASVPAILILAAFVKVWGGLVPPMFQSELINEQFSHANTQRINLAAPLFILLQIGIITAFYAGYLWPRIRQFDRVLRNRVIAAAILVAIASLFIPTTFSVPQGRYGGWWQLAKLTPSIAHISPFIVIAATIGGAATTAWALALPYRARWLAIAALAAFTAAQTANANVWQRYHEPLLLMGLTVLALQAFNISRSPSTPRPAPSNSTLLQRVDNAMKLWRWLGPAAFTALLTLTSFNTSWEKAPTNWLNYEPNTQTNTTQNLPSPATTSHKSHSVPKPGQA